MSDKKPLQINFQDKWIETVGFNEEIAYGDTDSLYLKVKLPFNKFESDSKTVDYSQQIAKRANENYLNVLNNLLAERAGINPEYNLMNFKSEVVAYRGFFRSKKYYALAKIWDEGNFFDQPKLKKTGGQILKADSTKIMYQFLEEIYRYLVLEFDIKDELELYKIVFKKLPKEYKEKIKEYINNFDIEYIGIPSKWGLKEFKNLPKQVRGAMLYNFLFEDVIRPGDSMLTVQIKIQSLKPLLNFYEEKRKNKNLSIYQLKKEDINDKLKFISIPFGIEKNKEKLLQIKNHLEQFQIYLDFDTIIDYNIDMKLSQFDILFSDEIKRKVL